MIPDPAEELLEALQEIVDRSQTRDDHIRAARALSLARRALQEPPPASDSAARRAADQRP